MINLCSIYVLSLSSYPIQLPSFSVQFKYPISIKLYQRASIYFIPGRRRKDGISSQRKIKFENEKENIGHRIFMPISSHLFIYSLKFYV